MFNIRSKIWITGIWRCFCIFYIYDIIAKSLHEKKGFKIYFHQQMNWNLAFLISVLKAKPTNTLSKLGLEDKILHSKYYVIYLPDILKWIEQNWTLFIQGYFVFILVKICKMIIKHMDFTNVVHIYIIFLDPPQPPTPTPQKHQKTQ